LNAVALHTADGNGQDKAREVGVRFIEKGDFNSIEYFLRQCEDGV